MGSSIGSTRTEAGEKTRVLNEELDIIGLESGGVVTFKGIPYAEAPLGNLRFCPPRPPKPWTETLDCTEFRSNAIQIPLYSIPGPFSEDCLFLNIWAPKEKREGGYPVFFWIHGGAFVFGSGHEPVFKGESFAEDGIILVTCNYRLGALGFLGMETLLEEFGTTGNWGFLDQIAALRWVNENIAAFGGDPGNITIGGESAGSWSVSGLLISPLAKGLFSRAILESGSTFFCRGVVPLTGAGLDKTIEMSKRYAAAFGLDDSREGLAKLREIDPFTLWAMAPFPQTIIESEAFDFWATLDGYAIPKDPVKALHEGEFAHVPVLSGNNKDESTLFTPPDANENHFERYVYKVFGYEKAQAVFDYYRGRGLSALEKTWSVASIGMIKASDSHMQKVLSEQGGPIYVYEFEYIPPANPMLELGARHLLELPFVFKTPEAMGIELDSLGKTIATQVHGMWANFIKFGDPNGPQSDLSCDLPSDLPFDVKWPVFDPTDKQVCRIGDTVEIRGRRNAEELDFFEKLLFS